MVFFFFWVGGGGINGDIPSYSVHLNPEYSVQSKKEKF